MPLYTHLLTHLDGTHTRASHTATSPHGPTTSSRRAPICHHSGDRPQGRPRSRPARSSREGGERRTPQRGRGREKQGAWGPAGRPIGSRQAHLATHRRHMERGRAPTSAAGATLPHGFFVSRQTSTSILQLYKCITNSNICKVASQ